MDIAQLGAWQPLLEPALTPATMSGFMPSSVRAFIAPAWAKPLAPPPLKATPIR